MTPALPSGAGPIGPARATDVVVIELPGDDSIPMPWLDSATVEIVPGLTVERSEEWNAVMEASRPRGENFNPASGPVQLYSFVRRHSPMEQFYTFDADNLIGTALALSRLVLPNTHCTEYAGRMIEGARANGERSVVPLSPASRFYAYMVLGERKILEPSDAEELAALMQRYMADRDDLPERVRLAMWSCEYASHERYREVATLLVTSGIESLIKTERYRTRAQFVGRVVPLAGEVGVNGIDAALAEDFYISRSGQAHGNPEPVTRHTAANRKLGLFHRTLQLAVRRAIEDPAFRATFESDAAIASRWPA